MAGRTAAQIDWSIKAGGVQRCFFLYLPVDIPYTTFEEMDALNMGGKLSN